MAQKASYNNGEKEKVEVDVGMGVGMKVAVDMGVDVERIQDCVIVTTDETDNSDQDNYDLSSVLYRCDPVLLERWICKNKQHIDEKVLCVLLKNDTMLSEMSIHVLSLFP